ncbi:hypothetical protein VMCG_07605 [Cytospora schulzeri]|uniref:Histone H2A/H2B/H3 domain-containing protein n=1 Tax=Cytospora schulzeri TaxID=448051 RepID=A0A423VX92_9PEZI|nr:hypothetical protein VMCG_07605 [Valsa malicola]
MPLTKNARKKLSDLTRKPCNRNGGGRVKLPKRCSKRRTVDRREQNDLITPKAAMYRLIREMAGNHKDIRFSNCALKAIHELAEDYLISRFEGGCSIPISPCYASNIPTAANLCAHHGQRITVMQTEPRLPELILSVLGQYENGMNYKPM